MNLFSKPLFTSMSYATSVKSILACAVLSVSVSAASMAQADPKPRPSQKLSAQMLANKYVGRMHVWKSCKGGVYFGGNWEAVAYCSKHKDAVGIGTWSTQGGKLCRELTWYSVKNGKLTTRVEEGRCDVQMVSDKEGQVWHNWQDDSDWWRGFPKDKNFTKGSKYKRQIAKLRKKYGV